MNAFFKYSTAALFAVCTLTLGKAYYERNAHN